MEVNCGQGKRPEPGHSTKGAREPTQQTFTEYRLYISGTVLGNHIMSNHE